MARQLKAGRLAALRSRKGMLWLGLIVAALVVAAVLPDFMGQYYVLVVFQALEYVALAQAWNLLAGYGGLVSLAPAASVGVGAYTAAVMADHLGLPTPLLIIAGGSRRRCSPSSSACPCFAFVAFTSRSPRSCWPKASACSWSTGMAWVVPWGSS